MASRLSSLEPHLLESHRNVDSVWNKLHGLIALAMTSYPDGAVRADAGGDVSDGMPAALKSALRTENKINTGTTGSHGDQVDDLPDVEYTEDMTGTLTEYEL